MPSLTNYKGLQVVSPAPTGDGGLAIQNDFKNLVDWSPKSVWAQSASPTANDDEGDDFHPGSMWLQTNVSPPRFYVCRVNTTGAAVWQQVALSAAVVPYTGATGNVDLGAYGLTTTSLTARGLDAGFDPAAPNQAAAITRYWIPRSADLENGWILDYQDELAFRDKKGAVVTMSPSPSTSISAMFANNAASTNIISGTAGGSIVIEVDLTSNPIQASGYGGYSLGLTFRGSTTSANPTHIKLEIQSYLSSDYYTVVDKATTWAAGYAPWVSDRFGAEVPAYDIRKAKLTLTMPDPLSAEFRLQRFMIYHATAEFDPWKLSVTGGQLYGSLGVGAAATSALTVAGPIATATATKTGAYTFSASDSVILADATSGAFTVTLPTAVGIGGRQYTLKRISSGANNVTLATTSSQTIDGASTKVLSSQYEVVTVVSNGSHWSIV